MFGLHSTFIFMRYTYSPSWAAAYRGCWSKLLKHSLHSRFFFSFLSFARRERWEASNVLNGQEVADPTNYCEKFALKLSFARLLLSCWPNKNNTRKLRRSIIRRKRRWGGKRWEMETVDYLIHDCADHCFYLSRCTAHILLCRFKGLLLFLYPHKIINSSSLLRSSQWGRCQM